jgi:hypothetical protein
MPSQLRKSCKVAALQTSTTVSAFRGTAFSMKVNRTFPDELLAVPKKSKSIRIRAASNRRCYVYRSSGPGVIVVCPTSIW